MIYDEFGNPVIRDYWELGSRLKAERKRVGLTQQELAEKFGVDKSSVYLYERGDRPPPASHLQALLDLGADVLYILSVARAHQSMNSVWLHSTVTAIRELEESGAWQKLDWEEREDLLMRFLKRPDLDDEPSN